MISQYETISTRFKLFLQHVLWEKHEFMAFKPEETDRLDAFFYKKLHDKSELLARWQLFRLLLCLAHGQADVERGFSVNKDMLVENMKTETFVAQRMVYDSVSSLGCAVIEVPITKSHRTSARAGKKQDFMLAKSNSLR